jgi:DNA uptake protein ComE-like DNA-binding protein
MIKGTWKDYFSFTRKERNAVFILLLILVLLIVAPYLVPAKKMTISIDENLQQQLDKYLQQHPRENAYETTSVTDSVPETEITSHELFVFDPNTLNKEGFKKLGLSDKIANTIINYRTKGGYFKTPGDIRKIYGLSKTDADRLVQYIKIASSKNSESEEKQQIRQPAPYKQVAYKPINVNTATAEEWKTLPGIGEVLGNRIVKFRAKLDGFKSIDDIRKTYGLSDSTFQVIRPYLILRDSAQ